MGKRIERRAREEKRGKEGEKRAAEGVRCSGNAPSYFGHPQIFDFVDGLFTHLSSAEMVAWASWRRLASAEGAESTEEDGWCEESGRVCGSDGAAGATSAR